MYTKTQFQYKIDDLEFAILSCLLIKPELMGKVVLEDKHFRKTQRMWQFMKSFYKKFKTFDINLMYSICKDKWQIVEYISLLLEFEPTASAFDKYQKQLIELYEEQEKDKWIIEKVYELANELLVRNISTNDFKKEIDKIYYNADEIYRKEKQDERN